MKKNSLFLMYFLCIIFVPCVGMANQDDILKDYRLEYEKISALLYPETKSWDLVRKMPAVNIDFLSKVEPTLKQTYLASNIIGKEMEGEGCSFIERIFSKEYCYGYFYIGDLTGNGNADIMYTGSSCCSEGDATLVWFASPKGYIIKQPSLLIQNGLSLRIKKGSNIAIASMESGCCGDVIDRYHLKEPFNRQQKLTETESYRITKYTSIPKDNNKSARFITLNELILRSSPTKDDKYDEERSEFVGLAVFGNILSKYLPGCAGKVMAAEKIKGTIWYFVALDKKCDRLCSSAPYYVNVGWTASKLIFK